MDVTTYFRVLSSYPEKILIFTGINTRAINHLVLGIQGNLFWSLCKFQYFLAILLRKQTYLGKKKRVNEFSRITELFPPATKEYQLPKRKVYLNFISDIFCYSSKYSVNIFFSKFSPQKIIKIEFKK